MKKLENEFIGQLLSFTVNYTLLSINYSESTIKTLFNELIGKVLYSK